MIEAFDFCQNECKYRNYYDGWCSFHNCDDSEVDAETCSRWIKHKKELDQRSFENDPIQWLKDVVKSMRTSHSEVRYITLPRCGKTMEYIRMAHVNGYNKACDDFLEHLE